MMKRLAAGLTCTFLAVLATACGSGNDGASTSTSTAGRPITKAGEGALLITDLNSLTERDLKSGAVKTLLQLEAANAFLLDPAVSPDGARIAFIQQPPPKVQDGRFDAGSDLWVMNRDGSGARLLFAHAQPNQLIRFPRWETNTSVLAIVQEISSENAITRVVYTLQRIDAATGERQRVMDDVLAFDISPDGQRLVFARLLPQAGEALISSGVSGDDEVGVVGADQSLAPFGHPRFSPDGQMVAFASADQTEARAVTGIRTGSPVQLVSLERDAGGRFWPVSDTEITATLLDGLPQDIWTVESEGGRAVRVADIKEDLPALTWDGSGERIYVMGVEGLYEVNLKTGAVATIAGGAFHAQLTWAP